MAQAGYTPIQLYYSTTASAQPSAGNLAAGELALNTADMKLYAKNSSGVVTLLASSGGASGSVTSVSVVSANGFGGTVANASTTPAITLTTSVTGILKGNGTAVSAAVSGTDYAPATSGTSILYGNGSGGFSSVTIGSGISFAGGTLSATGSGGTVTSVAMTVPAFLSVSGSPVTSSGTLAVSYSGTALPVANGGTNATSASITAFNNITGYTASGATGTTSTNLVFSTNPTITNPTVTNYTETLYTANTGTAITVSLANGTVQQLTLTGNATITMPTAAAGKSFIIMLKQDGTGSRTVTWSTVVWPGGTAPTITSTASKMDIYSFFSDGTNFYGVTVGQNY